jgi:hypothetical protein
MTTTNVAPQFIVGQIIRVIDASKQTSINTGDTYIIEAIDDHNRLGIDVWQYAPGGGWYARRYFNAKRFIAA